MTTIWTIFGFELIGAAFVAWGCLGELRLIFSKKTEDFKLPRNKFFLALLDSFQPAIEALVRFLTRRRWFGVPISEKQEHGWEIVYVSAVAFGVCIELAIIPFSLWESINSAKEAEKLAQTNLVLQTKVEELRQGNLKLEKQIQPRRISPEARQTILRFFKPRSAGSVEMILRTSDLEPLVFGLQIADVLHECRFNVTTNPALAGGPVVDGILYIVSTNGLPQHGVAVAQAFRQSNIPGPFSEMTNSLKEPGYFGIWIGFKPLP